MPLAFAANGTKNVIPEASQIGVTPGAASLNDGFPPLTFTPVAAGGVPPAGADFNGVLNLITASIRWAHGGGRYAFSSTFAADANVSGYPAGAMLMSADTLGAWLSLNDSNTDNPDTGAGTKWVPAHAYGVTAVTGLTNANVTLTPAQAAKSKITLAGTLTGNVQIILPTWLKDWVVTNNTTGAFTVTAKTAAGSGVAIPQDGSPTKITGDGTNIAQLAENVAPATQSQHAAQLQQIGHGQCVLSTTGTTNLMLFPMNGNNLIINGVPQQVPQSGVSYILTGTTAGTTYNVYAFMNAGVMALELSTTAHSIGANGVEVKTGDPTRTLVGKVLTSVSNTLLDNGTNRTIISWFNRKLKAINTGAAANSTSSTTPVLLGLACTFLSWSADSFQAQLVGIANNSTVNDGASIGMLLDGTSGSFTSSQVISNPASASQTVCSFVSGSLAEGAHTLQAQGAAVTGGNATFNVTITGFILG